MKGAFSIVLGIACLFGGAVRSYGHHSVSAEFDDRKSVELFGVITKIEWTNPHAWVHIIVHDPATGQDRAWAFQLSSPNALRRLGWSRTTLKVGDMVTINGDLSKDGWRTARAKELRLPDGQKIFSILSSPDGDRP